MPARFLGPVGLLAACCLVIPVPSAQAADAKAKLVQCVYQVADLVIPLPRVKVFPAEGTARTGEMHKAQPTQQDRLIQLIVQTVAPATWSERGGPGTIDYFPLAMSLVINQTPDVQEQVADLLTALRRLQDTEVAIEVRLLTVPVDFFDRLAPADARLLPPDRFAKDAQVLAAQPPARAAEGVTAQDFGLRFLMEVVQGDARTNVVQAPKVTLCNGQVGIMNATDTQLFVTGFEVACAGEQVTFRPKVEPTTTGFRMTTQPVVSADRRSVHLSLEIHQRELAAAVVPLLPVTVPVGGDREKTAPFTQYIQQPKFTTLEVEKTVAIPDGATVVFGGYTREREVRFVNTFGPPALSSIPYLRRLFENVGYAREWRQVFVMVTPRIIVQEEQEERQTGPAASRRQGEECEESGAEEEKMPPQCETASPRQAKVLAELLKAYDEACAEGRADEAEKFARAALGIDPTCFHRKLR